MLNLLINWRTGFWLGLLVFLVVGSFLPQTGKLLLASWWAERKDVGSVRWRTIRQAVAWSQWWARIQRVSCWCQAGMWLSLWLLAYFLTQPSPPGWDWLCLFVISHVAAGEIRRLLSGQDEAKQVERANVSVAQPDITSVEVTIDLEPILAELGDLSPSDEMSNTAREALTAKFERIRAECFQHPVGQAWIKQIDTEVQQVNKRVVEEALVHELGEHLGFARYERTGAAKPAHQHRSGTWGRSLRTMWGETEIRVPKLRKGNKERSWKVLTRYERNFGPWLDLQLHLYRLGLSQYDLQEILHLGFGQVLSLKAIQHLTDVAQREMEAFRQAPLDDTPPVVIVDGVNVKVLLPTGTYRTNQRGQR